MSSANGWGRCPGSKRKGMKRMKKRQSGSWEVAVEWQVV
jgi:hypothetical protein